MRKTNMREKGMQLEAVPFVKGSEWEMKGGEKERTAKSPSYVLTN